jgi:hypothetical protein
MHTSSSGQAMMSITTRWLDVEQLTQKAQSVVSTLNPHGRGLALAGVGRPTTVISASTSTVTAVITFV